MATTNTLSQPWQSVLNSAIDNQINSLAVDKTGDTMSGTLYLYNSAATSAAYDTQTDTGGTITNLVYQPSLVLGSNNVPTYTTTSGSTTTTTNYALALNGNTNVKTGADLYYNGTALGMQYLTGANYFQTAAIACNLGTPASATFTCQSVGHFHSVCITWGQNNPGHLAGVITNPVGGLDPNWVSSTTYEYTLFPSGTVPAAFNPSTNGRFAYGFFTYAVGTTITNPDILNMPCSFEISTSGTVYVRLYPTAGNLQYYMKSTDTNPVPQNFAIALPNICISWVDDQ